MNIQQILNTVQRGASILLPKIPISMTGQFSIINRNLHIMTQNVLPKFTVVSGKENSIFTPNLLQPTPYLLTQVCGMKVKGRLRLRCKDCYYIRSAERWYVRCKTHPRHKQAQIVKKEKNTWILTSVCQSKKRPWW